MKTQSKLQQTRRWWSTAIPNLTVGLDLGDRMSAICGIDSAGDLTERQTLQTTPSALQDSFGSREPCRVVLEAGTHSPWVSRLLESLGHEVIVANPARMRGTRGRKNDAIDAEYLARQGRADPCLLYPLRHRKQNSQADLALISSRDSLVRSRTLLINHVRGLVKSIGSRLPSCSAESFSHAVPEHVPEALRPAVTPLLETIATLTKQIRTFDQQIENKGQQSYPETALLRQVCGVGALTSLCYVLVLEDASRFAHSRSVPAYLGLTPKLEESGGPGRGRQLAISKAGHMMLRRLLVNSAHYILGPFGPDTDLRRWGLQLAARGGKNAKKRAVIAVARKLSVLLHRLWKTAEVYEPLRNARIRTQNHDPTLVQIPGMVGTPAGHAA